MNFTRTLTRLKSQSQASLNNWHIRKNSKMLKLAASVSLLGAAAIVSLLIYKSIRERLSVQPKVSPVQNDKQPQSFVKIVLKTIKKAMLAVIGSVVVGVAAVVSMPILGGLFAVNAVISLAKYVGGLFATNTANSNNISASNVHSVENSENKLNAKNPLIWSNRSEQTRLRYDSANFDDDCSSEVSNSRRASFSA